MSSSAITSISATGYTGKFTHNGAEGTFSAGGNKKLSEIRGAKEGYGTFDANHYGGDEIPWSYNPHFTDPTKATDLVQTMLGSIDFVQGYLDNLPDPNIE